MRIILTRLTSSHHRLEIVRADGARESADLETRSYLLHDLIHYAVEAEAKLEEGFWGLLAKGTPLSQLNDRERAMERMSGGTDIGLAEAIVGPVTALIQGKTDAAGLVQRFHALFAARPDAIPEWLTEGFLMRVMERMRRLLGQWKGTALGESMELAWPPEPRS